MLLRKRHSLRYYYKKKDSQAARHDTENGEAAKPVFDDTQDRPLMTSRTSRWFLHEPKMWLRFTPNVSPPG